MVLIQIWLFFHVLFVYLSLFPDSHYKNCWCSYSELNHSPEHKMDEQLPLQLEPSPPLSIDLLRTFPTVGTILRVIIDKVNQKHVLHLLNTGEWVKFISILCEVHAGLWCGVLTPFTKLRYLSNEDHFVLACQRYLYVCLYNTYFKYKCNWTLHVFNGEFKIDIASPLCIHVSKVIQWAFVAEIRAHPILVLSMVFTNYRFDIVDFLYDSRVCFIFSFSLCLEALWWWWFIHTCPFPPIQRLTMTTCHLLR